VAKIISWFLFLIAFFTFLASIYTFINLWSAIILKKELTDTIFDHCNCGMDCMKTVGIVLAIVFICSLVAGIFLFFKNNNGGDSTNDGSW